MAHVVAHRPSLRRVNEVNSVTSSSSQPLGASLAPDRTREPSVIGRIVAGLTLGVLALPTVWLLLFGAIIVRGRLALGYWPYRERGTIWPYQTIEHSMDLKVMPVHRALVRLGLTPTMLALVSAPLLVLLSVGLRFLRPRPIYSALWLTSATAVFMLVTMNVGQLWGWILY